MLAYIHCDDQLDSERPKFDSNSGRNGVVARPRPLK